MLIFPRHWKPETWAMTLFSPTSGCSLANIVFVQKLGKPYVFKYSLTWSVKFSAMVMQALMIKGNGVIRIRLFSQWWQDLLVQRAADDLHNLGIWKYLAKIHKATFHCVNIKATDKFSNVILIVCQRVVSFQQVNS